jgi:hypothetical protein
MKIPFVQHDANIVAGTAYARTIVNQRHGDNRYVNLRVMYPQDI